MRKLSVAVAVFAALTALVGAHKATPDLFVLVAAAALCAYTTWRARDMSSFLKIFACIFSTETIVFGLVAPRRRRKACGPQSLDRLCAARKHAAHRRGVLDSSSTRSRIFPSCGR